MTKGAEQHRNYHQNNRSTMLTKITIILQVVAATRQNVVSTAQGQVRGVAYDGYVTYYGIPYASITSAKDRFKSAGTAPVWSNIRESRTPTCSKLSEPDDCLQLDVYVPARAGKSWPVLVWVTGGGGPYNPGILVREGIIVVIVHHRVGPQGFLCLGDEMVPGNAGVKDVVLALRWVSDNIVAFRGNTGKIIAGGEGFGAAIVDAVILSSNASGLLHGAILQSGSALCPWAFNYDAKGRAKALSDNLELESTEEVLNFLIDTNIEDLVQRSHKLLVPYIPFGICIEKPMKNVETLLNEAPYELLLSKKVATVPMMIGYNSNEAYIFASLFKEVRVLRRMTKTPVFLLPQELQFFNSLERRQVARQIGDMYFKNISMASVLAYHRDAYFSSHIHRSVHYYSSSAPIFYYQFSYNGELGVVPEPGIVKSGAAHSDEIAYLFSDLELEGEDKTLQRRLVKLWTNFVKHLNPTPSQSEITWETTRPEHHRLLDIGSDLKIIDYPQSKTTRMWDDIYKKYYYTRSRIFN